LKLKCDELLSNVAFKFNLRRFNEAHLGYLSHAQAANDMARRRAVETPHFSTATVQTPAPFPSLVQIDAGHGSIPTRSLLNSMADKLWEVSRRTSN
jgi:hypothetical protein